LSHKSISGKIKYGDDPAAGFAKMMADLPPELAAGAMEVHGLDMAAPPPPMPTLI
jgi:hypothetical protein